MRRLTPPRPRHARVLAALALLLATAAHGAGAQGNPAPSATTTPELILRIDDIGMNHSVNLALEKIAALNVPVSASVMFACPWYQEAVEILRKNPHVSVGVHLVLNSEWKGFRWGP